jgi:hypothetical protein
MPNLRSPAVVIAANPINDGCNLARQIIGAVMTAKKRHNRRTVFGDCNH